MLNKVRKAAYNLYIWLSLPRELNSNSVTLNPVCLLVLVVIDRAYITRFAIDRRRTSIRRNSVGGYPVDHNFWSQKLRLGPSLLLLLRP